MTGDSGIGARVRWFRTAQGWTQARLAEAAGLTVEAVSRIETGHRQPRIGTLQRVATALSVTVETLMTDDGAAARGYQPEADLVAIFSLLADQPEEVRRKAVKLIKVLVEPA